MFRFYFIFLDLAEEYRTNLFILDDLGSKELICLVRIFHVLIVFDSVSFFKFFFNFIILDLA